MFAALHVMACMKYVQMLILVPWVITLSSFKDVGLGGAQLEVSLGMRWVPRYPCSAVALSSGLHAGKVATGPQRQQSAAARLYLTIREGRGGSQSHQHYSPPAGSRCS